MVSWTYRAHGPQWPMTLYTLMGARRREQIRKALTVWRSLRVGRRPKDEVIECHPGKKYFAKGLCKPCYRRKRYLDYGA